MRRPGRICWLALAIAATPQTRAAEPRRADVVVYGASAGGVIAAVAASREGKKVVIVEPGRHVGGMVSGGLGATDFGNRGAIGGISREFFRLVRDDYVGRWGANSPQVKDCTDGFRFEPHVADLVFKRLLNDAKVEVVFDWRLDGVAKEGPRITGITTAVGSDFSGSVFIDASYEGDLMARAGVRYAIGREGHDLYGESIAGVQARSTAHQWPIPVPALGRDGNRLPTVQAGAIAGAGSGDEKTQAYNYRLCMTDVVGNIAPFPKPADYDPARYRLLANYLALKPDLKVGQLMHPSRMPNGKTDTNNNGPFSTDHIGGNWDYPEADAATREKIRLDHVAYVQGFLYYLANDPHVPAPLHDEMARWGLAADEFLDTDHWPHQLYVRECRRMLGSFVMTQSDIMDDRTKVDSVGLGSYNTDSHHVQRVALPDGSALNEGDFQVHVKPYAIPYRSLVPKPTECSNLLVPVCMSASHVAYGSIRMEPVYMILGQACGVAAAVAINERSPVQAIPTEMLLVKLKDQGAILSPDEVAAPSKAGTLEPANLGGIVVDDEQAAKTGEWVHSATVAPFVGEGYLHDGGKRDGSARLRFVPKIGKAGRYEVRLYSTPNPNRATNTPVVVHSVDGERTVRVDQRKAMPLGGPIVVGVFAFDAGERGWVEVRNEGTDGHVIADAVAFVPSP